jgi:hypothetical protein
MEGDEEQGAELDTAPPDDPGIPYEAEEDAPRRSDADRGPFAGVGLPIIRRSSRAWATRTSPATAVASCSFGARSVRQQRSVRWERVAADSPCRLGTHISLRY